MSDRYFFEEIITPVGRMMMVSDSGGVLRMLEFMVREPRWRPAAEKRFKNAERIEKRNAFGHSKTLARYFDGDLTALDEIPVDSGGTEFQRAVWKALRRIPAGTTTSYGALAKKLGRPETMRAVGLANGANPVALVVPCHRVVGSDGSLTGYGGGLPQKRWLLDHEARHADRDAKKRA